MCLAPFVPPQLTLSQSIHLFFHFSSALMFPFASLNGPSVFFFRLSFSAAGIVRKKQWCEMVPCLEDEGCDLLVNKSGWTCTQPGGRVKTTTVGLRVPSGSEYCNVHPTRHLHTHTRKTKQKKVLSKEKL